MNNQCSVETCSARAICRGWCSTHYSRWQKCGDVRAHEPIGRKPLSQESREKIRASLTGRKFGKRDPEVGRRISAAKKGRPNGLLGKKFSDETKAKMSAVKIGAKNGLWKGDDVGYIAMHERARKVIGDACAHCKSTKEIQAALRKEASDKMRTTRMLIGGKMRTLRYSTDVASYMALCLPCHRAYDLKRIM